jgi:hypothetical protein
VTPSSRTTAGIAYDRAGPRGDLVVLLHAGVADRRDVGPALAGIRRRTRCSQAGSPRIRGWVGTPGRTAVGIGYPLMVTRASARDHADGKRPACRSRGV